MDSNPNPDIVREAERILQSAAAQSTPLRLLGGLAIRIHTSPTINAALIRDYRDIDLASPPDATGAVSQLMTELGYEENRRFTTLNAGRRGLFYDTTNERKVDLFVGQFEMCHSIPITDRLHLDPRTIPLAELLLTKLQIVELNEKDVRDIAALLLEHDVGNHDDETINVEYLGKLCGDDWGLWRTTKETLDRVNRDLHQLGLPREEQETVIQRLDRISNGLEQAPKSRRWRMRDRVGDRVRWYLVPEEAA